MAIQPAAIEFATGGRTARETQHFRVADQSRSDANQWCECLHSGRAIATVLARDLKLGDSALVARSRPNSAVALAVLAAERTTAASQQFYEGMKRSPTQNDASSNFPIARARMMTPTHFSRLGFHHQH